MQYKQLVCPKMLASSGFLGHVKLIPTAPCCLRARYLQQLPRIKQNVVCTQSTKARKVQKQRAPPKQGLPFEGRKEALPASPNQDEQAAQDVTASDRTFSVIIRVSTASACFNHCKAARCIPARSCFHDASLRMSMTPDHTIAMHAMYILLHCQSPPQPLYGCKSLYVLQPMCHAVLHQHCLQQQLCLAYRTVVVPCQKRCHQPSKG